MTIYIVNPNSSRVVTDGIDTAMQPLRRFSPVPIAAVQLDEGPKGIETQAHVDGVVSPLLARAVALEDGASAFVVACFSDPGLAALREQSRRPVLGIAESAILTAMTMGQRFGILSILSRSVPRHMQMLGALGVMDRLAADLPLELGVADLAEQPHLCPPARSGGAVAERPWCRGADPWLRRHDPLSRRPVRCAWLPGGRTLRGRRRHGHRPCGPCGRQFPDERMTR